MKTKPESPAKQETPTKQPTEKPVLGHVPLPDMQREFGGRKGPEATRFGDWELNGKCVDF
ncbi:MAG TPA: DUF1674 domain-containing protein [Alphaproteobacteria bacterium]|nr:DUF1674 domain-containing protein [Alphaproteobacteria bacterium]HNS44788.1 DUF1674 domain-containing protein [Alphaproteobacteria bacterium]